MNYRVVISVFLAAILLGPVASTAAQDKSALPGNFVLVPNGAFTIGSPEDEVGRAFDEGQRDVIISQSFLMGQHEVTVGAFRRFVEATGYTLSGGGFVWTGRDWQERNDARWDNPYFSQTDDQPVVLVSWYDAIVYSNWLSEREGLAPAYTVNGTAVTWNRDANGYRLPTEAEWEYAARAGATTAYRTGDTPSQANYNGGTQSTYYGRTTAVGSFPANAWGLYDMAGNAREWCWDSYGSYPRSPLTDPAGANPSSYKVHRGGSWVDFAQTVRFARRLLAPSEARISAIGFRLVKAVPEGYVPVRPQSELSAIVEDSELAIIGQLQAAFETWFNEGDDIKQLQAAFTTVIDQSQKDRDTIAEQYVRTELELFTDELQGEIDAFVEYLEALDVQIQPVLEEVLAEEPTVDQLKNELNALIDQLKDELDSVINDYEDTAIRERLRAELAMVVNQLKKEVNLIAAMYGKGDVELEDYEN